MDGEYADMRELAIDYGISEELFTELDISILPAFDKTIPICGNFLLLYKRAREQSSEKMKELAFWSAERATCEYENAQHEEVDFFTLDYVESDDTVAELLGEAYFTVAEEYDKGNYVSVNKAEATACYKMAEIFGKKKK